MTTRVFFSSALALAAVAALAGYTVLREGNATKSPPSRAREVHGEPAPVEPSREDDLAFVEAQFTNEPRDPAWNAASELSARIPRILPQGSSLQSIECRRSLCRVETRHRDMATCNGFVEGFVFSKGPGGVWAGATSFGVKEPAGDGDPVMAVAYLARGELPSLTGE